MSESSQPDRGAPTEAEPVYFSEHTGPGDDTVLLEQLERVIAQERAARGLDSSPEPAESRADLPSPAAEAPEVAVASAEAEGHSVPALDGSSSAPPCVGRVPVEWGEGEGARSGELLVERVEPIPHRPGCWYLVGSWPTGQGAVWELDTQSPWGRGTTIKIRWETGARRHEWSTGLFQVERVQLIEGMQELHGQWPTSERGLVRLPSALADWCQRVQQAPLAATPLQEGRS